MSDQGRIGLRPHQLLGHSVPESGAPDPKRELQEIQDVLRSTHQTKDSGVSVHFKKSRFAAALARGDRVKIADGVLSIGKQTMAIGAQQADRIALLAPNRCVISDLARNLSSKRPTLLSAQAGSGAAFTARWYLEATKTKHAYVRLNRSMTLDALVGVRRPDESNILRMRKGPLTRCIQSGGVLVIDALELADEEILGAIKSLAKGAEYFHHPGIEPIKVHPDFRLVLVTDAAKPAPADLIHSSNSSEIPAYSKADQVELLRSRHHLPAELAERLAAFHEKVAEKAHAGDLDYGSNFRVSWTHLDQVGRRIERVQSDLAVEEALVGIYGMRLAPGEPRQALLDLLATNKLSTGLVRRPRPSSDQRFFDLPSQRDALFHARRALDAGETVLLTGPGQCGVTRMVDELAARRGQRLCTVIGHAQSDAGLLMEMPHFTPEGRLIFKPGRLTEALLEGALIYIDHVDHMRPDRQNAFFQLMKLGKFTVLENGKLVEKSINKKTSLVLSSTAGVHPSRHPPSAEDKGSVTEIRLAEPSVGDALAFVESSVRTRKRVHELVRTTVESLAQQHPELGLTKLQRLLDFARTAALLTRVMGEAAAVQRAAELVLRAPATSAAMTELAREAGPAPKASEQKLWMQLLGLDEKRIAELLKGSRLEITPSMHKSLDALAIAHELRRPVMVLGPASSGKTVLGALFAKLTERPYFRVNLSESTEPRDVLGGPGVKNENGRTVVAHVEGAAMEVPEVEGVLGIDECTLNSEVHSLLKSFIDYRSKAIDAEANREKPLKSSFLIFTGNPVDAATARVEAPPTASDAMFHVVVEAKPTEERCDILQAHSKLPRDLLMKTVLFYQDLSVFISDHPELFQPAAAPYTFTERDMQKATDAAEHLIARDGIADPEEQRRILGREIMRAMSDLVFSAQGKAKVMDLLRTAKHFGRDAPAPARPRGAEKVVIDGVEYLQVGVARRRIRPLRVDPALDALIPKAEGLYNPVGRQWEVVESALLALELKQPLALVGPTGCGKTMLATWLSRQLNLPAFPQPCHADMRPEDFNGATIIDESGTVRYSYAAIPSAAKFGGVALVDEFQTAGNGAREGVNPVTERSQIQILNKRPAEVLAYEEWHPDHAFVFMTNTRKDNFSDPEASRIRVVGVPELEEIDDYRTIALRDSAVAMPDYRPPIDNEAARASAAELAGRLIGKRTSFGKLFAEALDAAFGDGELELPAPLPKAPVLEESQLIAMADLLHLADRRRRKASALLELCDHFLSEQPPELLAKLRALAPLPEGANARAELCAVSGGRLTDPAEAELAAAMFHRLREMVKASKTEGVSPLSPRIFGTYIDLYVQLRSRLPRADAAARAAHLSFWTKLPEKLETKAVALMADMFGTPSQGGVAEPPRAGDGGIWFTDTFVPFGRDKPWPPEQSRFPLTDERCQNLSLFASAVAFGNGRPITCTDDANGETLEEIREFGRRTGRPVTVVTLHPGVDLEGMIERYARSEAKDAIGGFEPTLQQIGQAVAEGHLLVVRGANNVPTNVLERLNSLGDGRMGLDRPRSKKWLQAHQDFRMVLLKKPGAANQFGPALENRLLEPLLTTRAGRKAEMRDRVGELGQVVRMRTGIPEQQAFRLAVFHTYVNDLLREHGFTSSVNVPSFLNRDAEAVGRRFAWLKKRGSIEEPNEMLQHLVLSFYGDRFDSPEDQELLAAIARSCFETQDADVHLSGELKRSPSLIRLGPFAVRRQPGRIRERVPGAAEMLPRTDTVSALEQKIFPALQFNEAIYLHGNETIAMAAVRDVCRMTNSPVFEVEASEKLSEAYLFGGLIQDPETGALVEHEGVLWQAQREEATLVIKDASRLPLAVQSQIAEIVATGHLTRVRDGELETRPRAFRLVVHSESAYLHSDLAGLCTRVRCPDLDDPAELEAILGHTLRDVPGASEVARLLRIFSIEAAEYAAEEDQSGRQKLSFGTARLCAAAREIAELSATGTDLEEALADVLVRLYLAPVRGLAAAEAKLRARAEQLAAEISSVLTAETAAAIDFGERPQLEDLDKDYRRVSVGLTRAVADRALVALEAAHAAGKKKRVLQLAGALASSGVVPETLAARARDLAGSTGGPGGDVAFERSFKTLVNALKKERGTEAPPDFRELLLEFLRRARLWDLEHRLGILDPYEELLLAVDGPEGKLVADIASARERFDAVRTLERIEEMRRDVSEAIAAYPQRKGQRDDQLVQLYEKLHEKWNQVSTSPIFVDKEELRSELAELDMLLDQFGEAHAELHQEGAEISGLVEALTSAGKVLAGLGIAEQFAELRRGLDRTNHDAITLVERLKSEVTEIARLEEAETVHRTLERHYLGLVELKNSNLFVRLSPDADGGIL